jgi:hypothetical protein
MSIDFLSIRSKLSLLEYCHRRGITLRRSGAVFTGKCPIHAEHNGASFVVDPARMRWRCFGKCAKGGDVVDLDLALFGGKHANALERLTGGRPVEQFPQPQLTNYKTQARKWDWRPLLRHGSALELKRLAARRHLEPDAVRLAECKGLLKFLDTWEGPAAVVTDKTRANAVARLVSGKPWANGKKAKMLPGSKGNVPIGVCEAIKCERVAIVEGGPDTLAAIHFAITSGTAEAFAPICMASANADFGADDIQLLIGKRIRIFPHPDIAGIKAGLRWLTQLAPVVAKIDVFEFDDLTKFDGEPAQDVNDLCSLSDESFNQNRHLIRGLMEF